MVKSVTSAILLFLSLCSIIPASTVADQVKDVGSPIPELAFTIGWHQYLKTDMADTYGGMLTYGARLSWHAAKNSWFFLGAEYGQESGNPYYDSPDFEGYDAVRLSALPLQMGFRWNVNQPSQFRFYLGFAFQAVWTEEEVPVLSETGLDSLQTFTGWNYGIQFLLGPEWRSHEGSRAFGLEIGYTISNGELGKGRQRYGMDLNSVNARVYFAIKL